MLNDRLQSGYVVHQLFPDRWGWGDNVVVLSPLLVVIVLGGTGGQVVYGCKLQNEDRV